MLFREVRRACARARKMAPKPGKFKENRRGAAAPAGRTAARECRRRCNRVGGEVADVRGKVSSGHAVGERSQARDREEPRGMPGAPSSGRACCRRRRSPAEPYRSARRRAPPARPIRPARPASSPARTSTDGFARPAAGDLTVDVRSGAFVSTMPAAPTPRSPSTPTPAPRRSTTPAACARIRSDGNLGSVTVDQPRPAVAGHHCHRNGTNEHLQPRRRQHRRDQPRRVEQQRHQPRRASTAA